MTLGFRDTRGVERTIGIAGGMYDPEDLARGIAERMTTADGDATYTGTFADGRFTFATAGGQPFDLLMSGRFVGATRASDLAQRLGFGLRDLRGRASYTSASPHTGGRRPARHLGTGVRIDPADPLSIPFPTTMRATAPATFDWGGTSPNQRRFTVAADGAPVIGSATPLGHFLITDYSTVHAPTGWTGAHITVESRATERIAGTTEDEISTTAPLGVFPGDVVALTADGVTAPDGTAMPVFTGVVFEELPATGSAGPNGGLSADTAVPQQFPPTTVRDGTRVRIAVHASLAVSSIGTAGTPLRSLRTLESPRVSVLPVSLADRLGVAARPTPAAAMATMPRQWRLDHPPFLLLVLQDPPGGGDARPHIYASGVPLPGPVLAKFVLGNGVYTAVREQYMRMEFTSPVKIGQLHFSWHLPDGRLYLFHGMEHDHGRGHRQRRRVAHNAVGTLRDMYAGT